MNSTREIEEAIAALPKSELEEFRAWFAKFDAENWDEQFEVDVKSGKLSEMAKKAISQHRNYKTKEI